MLQILPKKREKMFQEKIQFLPKRYEEKKCENCVYLRQSIYVHFRCFQWNGEFLGKFVLDCHVIFLTIPKQIAKY